MNKIIGVVGLIGSGKGTVGEYISRQYGYVVDSFASSLKDATACIFDWPRHLLEGDTEESREFRESVDEEWTKYLLETEELTLPEQWIEYIKSNGFTPRLALQLVGTEVFRESFHSSIWVLSAKRRINNRISPTIMTDVRFPNELAVVKELGGKIIRVQKSDELPDWVLTAAHAPDCMLTEHPEVHPSEWAWIQPVYNDSNVISIENSGTLNDLKNSVDNVMKNIGD